MDRYHKKQSLAKGRFAKVYLATDNETGKDGVMKFIDISNSPIPKERLPFLKLLPKINHPNLVKYIDCFLHKNNCVLVMEYMKSNILL